MISFLIPEPINHDDSNPQWYQWYQSIGRVLGRFSTNVKEGDMILWYLDLGRKK